MFVLSTCPACGDNLTKNKDVLSETGKGTVFTLSCQKCNVRFSYMDKAEKEINAANLKTLWVLCAAHKKDSTD